MPGSDSAAVAVVSDNVGPHEVLRGIIAGVSWLSEHRRVTLPKGADRVQPS